MWLKVGLSRWRGGESRWSGGGWSWWWLYLVDSIYSPSACKFVIANQHNISLSFWPSIIYYVEWLICLNLPHLKSINNNIKKLLPDKTIKRCPKRHIIKFPENIIPNLFLTRNWSLFQHIQQFLRTGSKRTQRNKPRVLDSICVRVILYNY